MNFELNGTYVGSNGLRVVAGCFISEGMPSVKNYANFHTAVEAVDPKGLSPEVQAKLKAAYDSFVTQLHQIAGKPQNG